MQITKFGHACVRLRHDGVTLVLDPGVWSQREALDGADAVLITHEHFDHYSAEHLAAVDVPVFTIDAVAAKIREEAPEVAERTTVVAPGESFEVAGLPVRAVGELHAVIHPELPRFHNSGYVITAGGEKVYHPGDALTAPDEAVNVLLAPVCAPWMRVSEGVDFARDVAAPRTLAIHDRVFSEAGLGVADMQMNTFLAKQGLSYARLADGEDLS